MISPKAKKVKKKAGPSEVDVNSPTSKKKKKEEPSQDDLTSPKPKVQKNQRSPVKRQLILLKAKEVIKKNEEPSEEELVHLSLKR